MDGADSHGQSFLQVLEDVGVDAGAGRGALGGRGLVQQLLESVQFDQQHHVLQEVALDERRELGGSEELRHAKKKRKKKVFRSNTTSKRKHRTNANAAPSAQAASSSCDVALTLACL